MKRSTKQITKAYALAKALKLDATDVNLDIIIDSLGSENVILERLREPSTQRGITKIVVATIAMLVPPEVTPQVIALGLLLVGAQGAVTPDVP